MLSCLGSQYAGWSLADETGGTGFFALGSGPGRAVAAVEELYGENSGPRHRHQDRPRARIGRRAAESVVAKVAEASNVRPED